jgi:acetyl-CoA carboxylase biotin carboxyl carrier protein
VRELIALAVEHGLAELEVQQGGTHVRIVRERAGGGSEPALPPRAASGVSAEVEGAAVPTNLITIEAPMVGTVYRAPQPEAAPFVREGDAIKEGQVLCIIEAMKLMNEIEARVAGRIAKILVENGQPVEYGEPLFLVDPVS